MRRIEIARGSFNAIDADAPQTLFVADAKYAILRIRLRVGTGSVSGTMQVYKAPSGTALTAGTAVQAATADISTVPAANTETFPALATGYAATTLNDKEALGVVFGGVITNLRDCFVEVTLRRMTERPPGQR